MARQVAYRCKWCGSWARVNWTKDMGENTIAKCTCSNPHCQAEFTKIISHFEDLKPPINQNKTQHLSFFGQ